MAHSRTAQGRALFTRIHTACTTTTTPRPLLRTARHLFIRIAETPNEACRKFTVPKGDFFLHEGTREYLGANVAYESPLAMFIFQIGGIRGVMVGVDFVAVTKEASVRWLELAPRVCEAVTAFAQSGQPAVAEDESAVVYPDTAPHEDDTEVIQAVKELIAGEVRPMVQSDGGDIRLVGYDDDSGAVLVTLQGACSSCMSSSDTLRGSVQRTLQHWLPEVTAVVRVTHPYAEEYRTAGCLTATGRTLEELLQEMDEDFQQIVAEAEAQAADTTEGDSPDSDLKWKMRGEGGGACSR